MSQSCIFCTQLQSEKILHQTEHFQVLFDHEPIQAGHLLIVSKQHLMDIRELSDQLLFELIKLEQKLVAQLYRSLDVDGVTIAENNGEIMDEGVHFHVHLIPRYQNDQFWDNQKVQAHQNNLKKLKGNLYKS